MAEIKSEVEDASELKFGPSESRNTILFDMYTIIPEICQDHHALSWQGTHKNNSELTRTRSAVFDKDGIHTLSNSEALVLLNQTQQVRKDEDASYVPIPMVQQTRQYLERFNSVKSADGLDGMKM